jgi:REP element-mobilizing transposase RayT
LVRHIDDLRAAINTVKDAHQFAILAMVVLPEHLHAIWRLPPDDADYPLRWSLIKAGSRGGWQKTSTFEPAAKPSVSEASGSGGIGNIKSGIKMILHVTPVIFIAIP